MNFFTPLVKNVLCSSPSYTNNNNNTHTDTLHLLPLATLLSFFPRLSISHSAEDWVHRCHQPTVPKHIMSKTGDMYFKKHILMYFLSVFVCPTPVREKKEGTKNKTKQEHGVSGLRGKTPANHGSRRVIISWRPVKAECGVAASRRQRRQCWQRGVGNSWALRGADRGLWTWGCEVLGSKGPNGSAAPQGEELDRCNGSHLDIQPSCCCCRS